MASLYDLDLDLGNPPKPYHVIDHGYDTSGRRLLLTARYTLFCMILRDRLDFDTWVVQGEWMSLSPGGGADDSAGYHDKAGNVDFHTSTLTEDQRNQLARKMRRLGGTGNLRGPNDGMPYHCHSTLMGTRNREASPGEPGQEQQYIEGTNGLENHAPDTQWRPTPLVTDFDYYTELRAYKEAQLPTPQDLFDAPIGAKDGSTFGQVMKRLNLYLTVGVPKTRERFNKIDEQLAAIEQGQADDATKEQIRRLRVDVHGMQEDLDTLTEASQ